MIELRKEETVMGTEILIGAKRRKDFMSISNNDNGTNLSFLLTLLLKIF